MNRKRRAGRRAPSANPVTRLNRLPAIAPPQGLEAWRLDLLNERFAVLEWSEVRRPLGCGLTPAEREVARLVLEGLSNAEIARRGGRSIRTVANQVASIFAKAGAGSRRELAARRA